MTQVDRPAPADFSYESTGGDSLRDAADTRIGRSPLRVESLTAQCRSISDDDKEVLYEDPT